MRSIRPSILVFALGLTLLASVGCERLRSGTASRENDQAPASPASANAYSAALPYGNPSNATTDPNNRDNYLVVHDSHVLSYNDSRGTMNWVAWRTTLEDVGERLPRELFQPDRSLPTGFRRIQYYDYSGSGYDRGHIVPSADRFANPKLNEQTFLMTNIVPQTGDLNQFPWNKLESYGRILARRRYTIYTIAGVYGEKERLRGKVTAPTNCWKVIVVLPRGKTEISASTRIIAVDMPNVDSIENVPWERYKTTVRSIEEKTGFDIFSLLPRELQDQIETRVDPNMLHSP